MTKANDEKGDVEDDYSGHHQHSDGGSDRIGNDCMYEIRGMMEDVRRKMDDGRYFNYTNLRYAFLYNLLII